MASSPSGVAGSTRENSAGVRRFLKVGGFVVQTNRVGDVMKICCRALVIDRVVDVGGGS